MIIRSKFCLTEIHNLHYGNKRYIFTAQYDMNIPEDQRFAKATPNGRFEMIIDNPKAQETFVLGKYYYFDASPVEVI